MSRNVSTVDRWFRATLGLLLVAATLAGLIGPWGWVGIVLLATAALSFCPLYTLLGIGRSPRE